MSTKFGVNSSSLLPFRACIVYSNTHTQSHRHYWSPYPWLSYRWHG